MAGDPGGANAPPPQTRFSADGFWWWDGAEWKPALSPDRLWRWNGRAWEPAGGGPATGSRTGVAVAIGITAAAFFGVLVLVAILVTAILLTMGAQISNLFSNVAAALGSPP